MKNWEELNGSPFRFWVVGSDRHADILRTGGSEPVVCVCICMRMWAGFNIRFRTGSMALRAGGGGVDAGRIAPLALHQKLITGVYNSSWEYRPPFKRSALPEIARSFCLISNDA